MKIRDFNRGWEFHSDKSAEAQIVNLPHDAMLMENRDKSNPSGGACAYFGGGKYSYKKKFNHDEENKNVIMHCEGIYQNSKILLNGEMIDERPYGYAAYYISLSEHLHSGENEIEIIAANADTPNTRYYSGAGIYRNINLLTAGESYILPDGVRISTTNNDTVHIKTEMHGTGSVHVSVYEDNVVVAEGNGNDVTLKIPNAKTWDEESPFLYSCKVELIESGKSLDSVTKRFGIRTLVWNGNGFFVNGKNTLLRGACVHHDNGILGACSFRDAEYRRAKILKEAGFNAIRSSHNPISSHLLEACDELGIYVMDETWDYWLVHKNPYDQANENFLKWWKQDVESMIQTDYNHPSVIMYSIGNEISELGTVKGQELCDEIANYVRAFDETRPVTCGVNLLLTGMAQKGKGLYSDSDNKNGSQSMDSMPTSAFYNVLMNKMGGLIDKMASSKAADRVCDSLSPILDIAGYNYATSRYQKESKARPDKCFVGSETLPKTLYGNWKLVKAIPNLIGDFMWTGWDYLGETGLGTIRYIHKKTKENAYKGLPIISGSGVIDICGTPQAEVAWNKIIWGLQDEPAIGVDPMQFPEYTRAMSMWRNTDCVESWSWEDCDGNKTNITIYASGARVELILNGRSLGKKKVKEGKAIFKNVKYIPGKIEAVNLDATGKEIGRTALQSATGNTILKLEAEKKQLRPNGQDLCFIELSLVGENGILKMNADTEISVQISGAGTLQGFGSAVPNTENSFISGIYTTYRGRALIAVRAGYEEGEIHVSVSTDGISEQTISIQVKGEE
jgi:beta-galactosidase/beta-glucuronidase